MAIPGKTLGSWGHHRSAMASAQAHVSIRNALASYTGWAQNINFDIFLQGLYENATNLRRDSDVDLVVQLAQNLPPRVVTLGGSQLEQDQFHIIAYRRWQSFRDQTLNALRATYGANAVTSGRKSLKLTKGRVPASADVVVTLHYKNGLAVGGRYLFVVLSKIGRRARYRVITARDMQDKEKRYYRKSHR